MHMATDEAPEIRRWVIQPLLDAGLDRTAVEDLVHRLVLHLFGAERRHPRLAELAALVDDQTPGVRAAWTEHLTRMYAVLEWRTETQEALD